MNRYGAGQDVPYSGRQEADLVNNPRYTGQSAGTDLLGHDGRGPAEESRYGAAPLNATGATPMPGVGGQNTTGMWPSPAPPPGAHRSAGVDEYGNPRREGVVNRMEGDVGVGPHSGYDARRGEPGYGTPGYDNYGQPRREGMVDKLKDAVGMGPQSSAYPQDAARGEHYADERGLGGGLGHHPHGTTTTGYDHSGDLNSGLGTGHHHDGVRVVPGSIPTAAMGERRVEPGYDASRGHIGHNPRGTLTGSPRKEGFMGKIKDAVGMGKHNNAAQTYPGNTTGTTLPNTYGTGETGALRDGTTAPGYSHNQMVGTGLGHERHPGSNTGYPHETIGERVEDNVGVDRHGAAGYPHNTTAAYPGTTTGYPHDAAGVGQHQGVTGMDYDHERRGKGFEDTSGLMDGTNTAQGYDVNRSGTDSGYDDSNVDYAHTDSNAPPKKGIMTKIKEKLNR